jgi:glycosyltransferase involved in cell wall biosynthesis
MRILYINTYDPSTEQHGGAAVTRSELNALRTVADIHTLYGAPLAIRRHHLSHTRLAADVIFGQSLKLASYRVLHRPASFYRTFDLIWCNHDFSAYDHEIFADLAIPYVLRKHNAEHKLVSDRHALGRLERNRIESFERQVGATSLATMHISSTEYRADSFSKRKAWLPPLLEDPLKFLAATCSYSFTDRPIDLLCVSNFDWAPNREGIEWFISEVMSRLPARYRLHLVGVGSQRYERSDRIVGHGFVEDLGKTLNQAKLFVSPVLSGAGVKIKNVTAMAAGLPLVTTPCGIDGIHERDDPPVASVAQAADEFAQEITRLLSDEAACTQMSYRSLDWARQRLVTPQAWLSKVQATIGVPLS